MASSNKAIALAQDLADKIEEAVEPALQEQVVKFIETILVYKFPKLSRQEIEAMFNYSDLKKTRVYQEAKEEGEQIGLKIGLQGQVSSNVATDSNPQIRTAKPQNQKQDL